MFKRKLLLPLALAAAAGTPYVVMEKGWSGNLWQKVDALVTSEEPPPGSSDTALVTGIGGPLAPEYRSEFAHGVRAETPNPDSHAAVMGPPATNLGEVLRFDVSPDWVTGRWPRVTTVLAEQGLEGLRVPLVTGTDIGDLAGSLTYYFDRYHRVQRLAFDGYTGDERRLLAVIVQHYGLQPEPTLDAAMYVARWNGRPSSVVRISRAPIITHDSPHSQLHVMLELNRPSHEYGLSPEFVQILERDRNTRRW